MLPQTPRCEQRCACDVNLDVNLLQRRLQTQTPTERHHRRLDSSFLGRWWVSGRRRRSHGLAVGRPWLLCTEVRRWLVSLCFARNQFLRKKFGTSRDIITRLFDS